jgi:hypothetical protein
MPDPFLDEGAGVGVALERRPRGRELARCCQEPGYSGDAVRLFSILVDRP